MRKGNAGLVLHKVEDSEREDTSLGVNACACMWLTPKRGICHATARPFAVSSPVIRLDCIPGPRVTVIKFGRSRSVKEPQEALLTCIAFVHVADSPDLSGKDWRALLTSSARDFWCDSRATSG